MNYSVARASKQAMKTIFPGRREASIVLAGLLWGCGSVAETGTDATCSMGTCTNGVCDASQSPAGTPIATQTEGDCASLVCNAAGSVVLAYDAADMPTGKSCPSTTWDSLFTTCGTPPPSPPAVSFPDCNTGVDPTKQGGDLLWVSQTGLGPYVCPHSDPASTPWLAVGPTGDVAVGTICQPFFLHGVAVYKRLNAAGTELALQDFDLMPSTQDTDTFFTDMSFRPTNDLDLSLGTSCIGSAAPPVCAAPTTVVNAPDGTTITPPPWVSPIGTVKTATSTTSLDLGCGALPAAPQGSTFVARLDVMGNCIYAQSLPAPNLNAVMDATGRVVVSGLVGPMSVDVGAGPLAPLGDLDYLIVELDVVTGQHVWSRRVGSAGVSLTPGTVTISAAGNVVLLTRFDGFYGSHGMSYPIQTADFGGGVLSAELHDPIVASYSPSGAHRWSRAYHFATEVRAAVDGCGALVVGALHPLTPNCSEPFFPLWPAVARFAP